MYQEKDGETRASTPSTSRSASARGSSAKYAETSSTEGVTIVKTSRCCAGFNFFPTYRRPTRLGIVFGHKRTAVAPS